MRPVKPAIQRCLRYLIITVAALSPVLVMAPLVAYESAQYAEAESSIIAITVQRQLDRILDVVVENIEGAARLLGPSCNEILPALVRRQTLTPYFRALLLVRNDRMYCSSVEGEVAQRSIAPFMPAMTSGFHILPMSGTPLVPDRPALIVTLGIGDGQGVIAIVDGQYLQDIQIAAAQDGQFRIRIVHTGSQRLLPGGRPYAEDRSHYWIPGEGAWSVVFPVAVHVDVAPLRSISYRRELWKNFAPFLLLAAILMGGLANRLCLRRFSLVTEIRQAMSDGEFFMAYQPLMDLASGRLRGVEALVRWHRPGRDRITPDIFIPLAEENGLITELTCHILDLIAHDLPRLRLREDQHLGINISGSHLVAADFVDDMRRFLEKLGPSHPRVVLELTEREALPDAETATQNLRRAKALGMCLALDDFGTGHSSASHLARFEVDFIKLDRSYVQGIETDTVSAVILDTIINLGHQLDVRMIAEGVESGGQATYLCRQGVQLAQGYLYAPALRVDEFLAWRSACQGGE